MRAPIGLYPMGSYRATAGANPPKLVLGFGDLGEAAIDRGIGAIADLLRTG